MCAVPSEDGSVENGRNGQMSQKIRTIPRQVFEKRIPHQQQHVASLSLN
jgi:hypothetical protein